MFCAIPLPFHVWDDDSMDLVQPCFPLVGALIGLIWLGITGLLSARGAHPVLSAAIVAATPFLLSGFLHLDGFADTCDAILSRRPMEEKLRILKDPHTGVFAVAALCLAFMLQFAAVYAVISAGCPLTLLLVIPVLSRGCASLAILCLKTMPTSGYGAMFKANTRLPHKAFAAAAALGAVCLSAGLAGRCGLAVSAGVVLGYALAIGVAYREFDGVSGDLAGFALVISELCGLIVMGVTL